MFKSLFCCTLRNEYEDDDEPNTKPPRKKQNYDENSDSIIILRNNNNEDEACESPIEKFLKTRNDPEIKLYSGYGSDDDYENNEENAYENTEENFANHSMKKGFTQTFNPMNKDDSSNLNLRVDDTINKFNQLNLSSKLKGASFSNSSDHY